MFTRQPDDAGSKVNINDQDRDFLAVLWHHPDWTDKVRESLKGLKLPNTPICLVLSAMLNELEADTLPDESSRQLYYATQNAKKTWKDDGEEIVSKRINLFKKIYMERKIEQLDQAVKEAQQKQNKELYQTLTLELIEARKQFEHENLHVIL